MRDACLSIDKVDWKLFSGTRKKSTGKRYSHKNNKKKLLRAKVGMHKMFIRAL